MIHLDYKDALGAASAPKKAVTEKTPTPRRPGGKTKRGPNKWLLRIFRGYDANKKRIYYCETFHGGSKDADDRLTELKNRQKAGLPLKFQPKLFRDYFNYWIEEADDGERRECTIEHYRKMATKYLLPAFGSFALTDVTDVAIKRFYKGLRKEGYAPATISLLHVILSGIFKSAEDADLVLRNPMRKVKAPEKTKPNPVAMTGDEAQKFLDTASSRPEGFMFRFAYFLGARPCEYLALKWSDLEWKAQRVTIQRSLKLRKGGDWYTTPPKTKKSVRSIALTSALVKDLEDHRRQQLEMRLKAGAAWADHGFIFTDEVGEPLKIYTVRKLHKRICAEAELPATFSLKVSRHSCASALMNDGVPLKMISDRLGHSSIEITADVYGVTEDQRQREVSERVERLFRIGKK
jgi:integrase